MSKIALLLLLFSSELAAQTLSPQVQEFVKVSSGVIVLSHVRVIDGTGAPALENQAVIVRQDRIENGKKFVINTLNEQNTPLTLVVNWTANLKEP